MRLRSRRDLVVSARIVSKSDSKESQELVVADDGSIPTEQISRLGLHLAAHLRVMAQTSTPTRSIAGRLTNWPDLAWEDFGRAIPLAQTDTSRP